MSMEGVTERAPERAPERAAERTIENASASAKDSRLRRRVFVGTASNFVGQLFVFATSFLLTPILLDQLGAAIYGLWILLGSIVAYSSILDFGIWGTVIKYVAEYQAQGNDAGARALLSTVFAIYVAIALLIFSAGLLAAPLIPQLFQLAPEHQTLATQLVILLSLATGMAVPCMFPLAILRGLQRYDLVNSIDIANTLLVAVATVAILWLGGGVIGLAILNICSLLMLLGAGLWALRRIAPQLTVGWGAADLRTARYTLSHSWPLFLRDFATRLQTRTDEITIGFFLPVSAVGSYNIARRLSEATQTLTRQFMKTLLPLASQLHAENDLPRLAALYKTGTRLTLALVLSLSLVLVVLAGPLLTLWVGSQFAVYAGVVVVLTFANLIATLQWPAMAILQTMSRHRILAATSLGNGIANLALSLLLVRPLGLVGVALGTALPVAVEYFVIILPYSLRASGIHLREAVREIFVPALLPGIPMFVVLNGLTIAAEPASLLALVTVTLVSLLVYAATYLSLPANRHERQWFFEMIHVGYRLLMAGAKRITG